MRIKYILFCSVLIFSIFSNVAISQHNLNNKTNYIPAGLVGGANFLSHRTSIPIIPGSNDCGNFENGESIGYFIGISAGYPIIKNFLIVDARLTYDYRPADLSAQKSSFQVYTGPGSTNEYRTLELNYSYSTSLTYLNFDIGLKVFPIEQIPLFFRASFDAGNPLFNSSYSSKIRIVAPESALLPSGKKEENISSGELNAAGTATGISGTLGYEIQLQKNFFLAPEISYRYGMNSVISNSEWKTNMIRFGLNAFWTIPLGEGNKKITKEPEIIPEHQIKEDVIVKKEPEKKKEIVKKTPEPVKLIKQFNVQNLHLTETIVTETYPLLLYLFFDKDDYRLSKKYQSNSNISQFSEENLPTNTLSIYDKVLDIIGYRMRKFPETTITLTGTTDGKELPSEEERLALGRKRTESVKDYLVRRWNISRDRIITKSEDKPSLPTSVAYTEGFEENRRVEISSTSSELLAPVIHSKFLEYSTNQKTLEADITLEETKIAEWNFAFKDSNNNDIYKTNGFGKIDTPLQISINKILINEAARALTNNKKIKAELNVKNYSGKSETKEITLQTTVSKNQFEVGRLNLIVFDFDKYDISTLNKQLIVDFVQSSIHKNSIVKISGSTDRLGEAKYNMKLSYNRAKAVWDYLQTIQPGIHIEEIIGKGASDLQYDNNLPEGRFYCRTVMIEISTPIDK